MEAASPDSLPLGRQLVAQGLLTDAELDAAILFQELTGRPLGATLVDRGFITPTDLAGVLAEQLGIEIAEPDTTRERTHLRLVGPDEKPAVIEPRPPSQDPLARLEAAIGRRTANLCRAVAHLLFVPAKRGYTLVHRDGPPPAHGSSLVVDGLRLTVTKLGRSPLPGDGRPCAYLQR